MNDGTELSDGVLCVSSAAIDPVPSLASTSPSELMASWLIILLDVVVSMMS